MEKVPYLFVPSFEGGTIAPKAGEAGAYTVTLEHGLGQTLYFAGRPSRDVGAVPTGRFLAGLGFPDDNPPNAALVVDDGGGRTDIAVVELRNPLFDPTGLGVSYDVTVLANWEDSTELGLPETAADLADLPASFGPAHLFIDDCAPDVVLCVSPNHLVRLYDELPFCFRFGAYMPCDPSCTMPTSGCPAVAFWSQQCNDYFQDCGGQCVATFTSVAIVCPSGPSPSPAWDGEG